MKSIWNIREGTRCLISVVLVTLAPVLSSGEETCGIRTVADLRGKHVAYMSSDFHRRELKSLQPEIVFDLYSEYALIPHMGVREVEPLLLV